MRLGNSPKVSELAPCIIGRHNCIRQLWLGYAVAINGPENLESESEVAQLCPTVCNPMDCSLLGSSVHGFFQARILEWVSISFSRRSSQYRDWTQVSHIVDRHFTIWATREVTWHAAIHGVAKSWTWLSDWTELIWTIDFCMLTLHLAAFLIPSLTNL